MARLKAINRNMEDVRPISPINKLRISFKKAIADNIPDAKKSIAKIIGHFPILIGISAKPSGRPECILFNIAGMRIKPTASIRQRIEKKAAEYFVPFDSSLLPTKNSFNSIAVIIAIGGNRDAI
jgi:hypothetical protein